MKIVLWLANGGVAHTSISAAIKDYIWDPLQYRQFTRILRNQDCLFCNLIYRSYHACDSNSMAYQFHFPQSSVRRSAHQLWAFYVSSDKFTALSCYKILGATIWSRFCLLLTNPVNANERLHAPGSRHKKRTWEVVRHRRHFSPHCRLIHIYE